MDTIDGKMSGVGREKFTHLRQSGLLHRTSAVALSLQFLNEVDAIPHGHLRTT